MIGMIQAVKATMIRNLILAAVVAMLPLTLSATPHPLPPVPLTTDLTFDDAHEIGSILNDFPEGLGDRVQMTNFLLLLALGQQATDTVNGHTALVTRTNNIFAVLDPAVKTGFKNGGQTTIDLGSVAGVYCYLFAKYSGGDLASDRFVWFVGDLTGLITIPELGPNGRHLGDWTLLQCRAIGSVPDGGTTVMLLGLGLGALGAARRWLMS
jgi:hypothetical protein